MSIIELGALGEFIGAVLLFGSLVFVGLQIRQNTKSIRASTYREAISDFAYGIEELNHDPELTQIWFDGMRDFESLSREDKQRLAIYCTAILRRYENVLFQV